MIKEIKFKYTILLVILLIIFITIVSTYYITIRINPEKQKLMQLRNEINTEIIKSQSELSKCDDLLTTSQENLSVLSKSFLELNSSYRLLKDESLLLKKQNKEYNTDIQDMLNTINDYEADLQDSMSWFQSNSRFWTDNTIARNMKNSCFEMKSNTCYIKTACLYLYNEEYYDLRYRSDVKTTGSQEKLQSLKEFIDNNGGDCEDYALFYKAEWNSILDACEGKKIVIDAWRTTDDLKDKYWVNFEESWYLEYVEGILFEKNYIYPVVVCGNLYDSNTHEINGHCIIALTNKKIESINDISYISNAILIEPQTGEYLGRANDYSSNIYLLGKNNDYYDSYISAVITDTDFYLFSITKLEWEGYGQFYNILHEKKLELEQTN